MIAESLTIRRVENGWTLEARALNDACLGNIDTFTLVATTPEEVVRLVSATEWQSPFHPAPMSTMVGK